jgi:hypothetical protein
MAKIFLSTWYVARISFFGCLEFSEQQGTHVRLSCESCAFSQRVAILGEFAFQHAEWPFFCFIHNALFA